MALIIVAVLAVTSVLVLAGWGISLNNQEVSLRTSVEAKQLDNKNQLANMKNKFRETAQVSEKEAQLLTDAFVKYASARSGNGGGSFATLVTEAVPTINPTTLRNLQNIVESSRNSWTTRQSELVDINRAHTQLLRQFPGNILFGILGRKEISIVIVTSTEAEEAFRTGKEEATKLF